MDKWYCSICKRELEPKSASILSMGKFSNPRYMCESCSSLFDKALLSHDFYEIEEAVACIGDAMERAEVDDELVIEEVGALLSSAKERAFEIRDGIYDFSKDEPEAEILTEEELAELSAEEPEETEEERLLREKNEKTEKIFNIITQSTFAAIVGGFIIYMLIRFIIGLF